MFSYQNAPRSLCLLRLSAIGDVTHVLPTLRTIQHYWPDTAITWIIGAAEKTLVDDIPGVEFVVFDKNKGVKAFWDLGKELKGRRFDLMLNLQNSFRASLCSKMISCSRYMDFTAFKGKNRINHRKHVLDGFLEFPRSLGLEPVILRWDLPIPERDKQDAMHKLPEKNDFLVINPCSSNRFRNYRNWRIESYVSVIEQAAERYGLHAVLTGGPAEGEKEFASAICSSTHVSVSNLVGQTTLKQLAAVLERAKAVISPDTGCAHIANAVGTPVIGLYATSNPERTGPYLCLDITVNRYPDAVYAEYKTTPDELPWGKRVRDPKAMDLISVGDVVDKLDKVLNMKKF